MNNLAPMKNCPGVQGNLNWMPFTRGIFTKCEICGSTNLCPLYSVHVTQSFQNNAGGGGVGVINL